MVNTRTRARTAFKQPSGGLQPFWNHVPQVHLMITVWISEHLYNRISIETVHKASSIRNGTVSLRRRDAVTSFWQKRPMAAMLDGCKKPASVNTHARDVAEFIRYWRRFIQSQPIGGTQGHPWRERCACVPWREDFGHSSEERRRDGSESAHLTNESNFVACLT